MNRDQIIGAAFRKVVSLQTLTPAQILVATEHLNTIMQEEDAICASKQQPALWATVRDALPLKTARQVYTTTGPNSTQPAKLAITSCTTKAMPAPTTQKMTVSWPSLSLNRAAM